MPFNLLLLPLLGGYFFTHVCYVSRFRAYRLTGSRIVIEAAGAGTLFLIISHCLVVSAWIRWEHQLLPWARYWSRFAPFEFTSSALGSLILALLFTVLSNLIIGEQRSTKLVVKWYGDELAQLLLDAFYSIQPVMLTLNNGKVYVGLLDKGLGHDTSVPYISILPTLSGYRDKDTQKVQFTVNYHSAYVAISNTEGSLKHLDARAVRVIVPTAIVCSARLFDSELYESIFNSSEKPAVRKPRRSTRRKDRAAATESSDP